MKKNNYKKGMMLVEMLVAVFIFSIILGILVTVNNLYLRGASSNLKSVKATYLAEEGMEALKIIRDTDWNNFQSLDEQSEYYFYFSPGASSTWQATTSVFYKNIDSINRWFILEQVCRDIGDQIVDCEIGSPDLDIKKATVFVSWEDRGEIITKSMSSYLSNIIVN